jgi:hypothetical protein
MESSFNNNITQCRYIGLNHLQKDIDDFLEKTSEEAICVKLFAYKISKSHQDPFLTFLLHNSCNMISMPTIFLSENNFQKSGQLQYFVENQLIKMMNTQNYNNLSCENIEFKGFYIDNNKICMFFDLTNTRWTTYDTLFKTDCLWFGIIDEMVNKRSICNIPIHISVTDFFVNNPNFCLLEDNMGNKVEAPVVAYRGKHLKQLIFTYIFGVSQMDKTAMFGSYYYFTDYHNAIKQGGWIDKYDTEELNTINQYGKYDKGGIIRFAIFMNKIKYVENKIDDVIDNSDIKYNRLRDENLNTHYENLTIRISDHNGNWANEYDSLFVGRVMLDNDEELQDTPMIVVKNYEQQCPLSYHLIDKKYLDEQYNKEQEYHIM